MTLLTDATPKIGNYPFTTLHANVGVMQYNDKNVILADIPGLIDGAHENRGLGIQFLKHIERCSILMFVIDMSGTDGRDPSDDYNSLLFELKHYDSSLLDKSRIIVANKMDIESSQENLKIFKKRNKCDALEISCLTRSGISNLQEKIAKTVFNNASQKLD